MGLSVFPPLPGCPGRGKVVVIRRRRGGCGGGKVVIIRRRGGGSGSVTAPVSTKG